MNTFFILVQLLNLGIFTAFILAKKEKPEAKPLIDIRAIQLLRLTYLLPIIAFAWSLFLVQRVTPLDWVCLLIAIAGTVLVVKGKIDLGTHHTWTGYYLPHAPRIHSGIFSWIAHPMYAGIIMVILSCSAVYVTRLPWYISALALLCCTYISLFLIIVALREEKLFVAARV
ncbi:methyltransferase [Buttiauxella noackiae]|uniref:methyltransferase n=1 Tax=Buttiauxella noackiae TaxID=82992 RepID=UPI0005545ACB|nr:methyltransferase [Buttiauxella noackiae]